jgi:hypothetical protein
MTCKQKTASYEVQWLALTHQIEAAEAALRELRAQRLAIKPEVMRGLHCWGLRDEAVTKMVAGK